MFSIFTDEPSFSPSTATVTWKVGWFVTHPTVSCVESFKRKSIFSITLLLQLIVFQQYFCKHPSRLDSQDHLVLSYQHKQVWCVSDVEEDRSSTVLFNSLIPDIVIIKDNILYAIELTNCMKQTFQKVEITK